MAVPGIPNAIANIPVRAGRAALRLGTRFARLAMLAATATVILLLLDVLLLGKRDDGASR